MNLENKYDDNGEIRILRPGRYGTVEGLDDSELASGDELERWVYLKEFAPILKLPVKNKFHGPRPEMDEDGHIGWGAFGSVDFERFAGPVFDSKRYKLEKLKEERRDVRIMMSIISERLPGRAKYMVLKYLKLGVLDLEHITDYNMWSLGRRYLKYLRLKKEIKALSEKVRW